MEIISKIDNSVVWYSKYPSEHLSCFPLEKPFVCMIWNGLEGFIDEKLIEKILNGNCKYFLAGGYNRDSWELEADSIDVYQEMQGERSVDNFACTTTHEHFNEMLFFGLHCANDEAFEVEKNILLIQIGSKYSKSDILEILRQES